MFRLKSQYNLTLLESEKKICLTRICALIFVLLLIPPIITEVFRTPFHILSPLINIVYELPATYSCIRNSPKMFKTFMETSLRRYFLGSTELSLGTEEIAAGVLYWEEVARVNHEIGNQRVRRPITDESCSKKPLDKTKWTTIGIVFFTVFVVLRHRYT